MGRIFIPTSGAEDWRLLLADPDKHWRSGYSAKALAYCWEEANGFPPEVLELLLNSQTTVFQDLEMLLAFPEWQVSLPGGRRPSQNDLFILAKSRRGLITITVEGKVTEPFDKTLEEWLAVESSGRKQRYEFLKKQLGLDHREIPGNIRYQLLHRMASAVIEATRFNAKTAVMIVHSFSQNDLWFEDYQSFINLFDGKVNPNSLVFLHQAQEIDLYSGWVRGDPKYLTY